MVPALPSDIIAGVVVPTFQPSPGPWSRRYRLRLGTFAPEGTFQPSPGPWSRRRTDDVRTANAVADVSTLAGTVVPALLTQSVSVLLGTMFQPSPGPWSRRCAH